jgi:phage I-like protein
VVSTDISGIPELVAHGKTGWLVPQKDPRALAEALRTLLGDAELRERIAAAGATRVRREFSSEPGIDFIANLLRDSVSRQAAALSSQTGEPKLALQRLLRRAEAAGRVLDFLVA